MKKKVRKETSIFVCRDKGWVSIVKEQGVLSCRLEQVLKTKCMYFKGNAEVSNALGFLKVFTNFIPGLWVNQSDLSLMSLE